jgi:hypothetical protein
MVLGGLRVGASPAAIAKPQASSPAPPSAGAKGSDLDEFMERVLQRRDESWRKLHDYILSETETFSIDGAGQLPISGFRREFTWYVREGYLVRSPVRFDGVAIPEADRRKYEEQWLAEEKRREARAKAGQAPAAASSGSGPASSAGVLVNQRAEPRFVSEAYFLQFKFEPGNYYLAGREPLAGCEVVRVEYYPTHLFGEDEGQADHKSTSTTRSGEKAAQPPKAATSASTEMSEDEIDRKLNKSALVTLWIDPAEHQIVKYAFDNMGFGFLPGRWLLRIDEMRASMTMARVLDGVWLPAEITMRAGLQLATGRYTFRYARTFYDYKKAEVGARIRTIGPRKP